MRERLCRVMWSILLAVAGACLFQSGCMRTLQRELDLLTRPEPNLNMVYDSVLVDVFGPGILEFW